MQTRDIFVSTACRSSKDYTCCCRQPQCLVFSHGQVAEAAWVDTATRFAHFLRVALVGKQEVRGARRRFGGRGRKPKRQSFLSEGRRQNLCKDYGSGLMGLPIVRFVHLLLVFLFLLVARAVCLRSFHRLARSLACLLGARNLPRPLVACRRLPRDSKNKG